jgi:hypothetical protein
MVSQLDAAFDAQVRAKLHALTLPLDPEAWTELAARLDAVFDALVREQLRTLSATGADQDWPIMAALLAHQPFDAALLKGLLALQLAFEERDWQSFSRLMDDDPLVSHVRETLSQWELPLDASAWPAMQASLDQVFDQSLRDKLEAVAPTEDTLEADWAMLEEAMPGADFDLSIRNKLAALALPFQPADWDELANTLDAPFDQQLRSKLLEPVMTVRPDVIDAGWQRLAANLPRVPVVAETTWWYQRWQRPVAAALILLLLSTAGATWWISDRRLRSSSMTDALPAISPDDDPTTDARPALGDALSGQADFPATAEAHSSPQEPEIRSASTSSSPSIIARVAPHVPRSDIALMTPSTHELAVSNAIRLPETAELAAPITAIDTSTSLRPIRSMPTGRWALAAPFMPAKANLAALVLPDSRPPDIRIGLLGSTTRTKAELSGPAADPGYLAGLRIEMLINPRWQVIAGLTYGSRRFSHIYYRVIDDQSYPNALDANMQLVEVPLMMRYHFPSQGRLSLYAQAGIVTVITILETYTHYDPSNPANKGAFDPVPYRLQPREQAWSLNTYPGNVQVALGLEYEVSKRMALQIEPFFQQSLQRTKGSGSVGLEKKLYTTGISLSTMFRLSKPAE